MDRFTRSIAALSVAATAVVVVSGCAGEADETPRAAREDFLGGPEAPLFTAPPSNVNLGPMAYALAARPLQSVSPASNSRSYLDQSEVIFEPSASGQADSPYLVFGEFAEALAANRAAGDQETPSNPYQPADAELIGDSLRRLDENADGPAPQLFIGELVLNNGAMTADHVAAVEASIAQSPPSQVAPAPPAASDGGDAVDPGDAEIAEADLEALVGAEIDRADAALAASGSTGSGETQLALEAAVDDHHARIADVIAVLAAHRSAQQETVGAPATAQEIAVQLATVATDPGPTAQAFIGEAIANASVVTAEDMAALAAAVRAAPPSATEATLVAADDDATTVKGTSITIEPLANDIALGTDPIVISANTSPVNGELTLQGDSFVYSPAPGYTGTDDFEYTIVAGSRTTSAKVHIVVDG